MSLDSVDDVTRSLNELRRMLAADDLSGVRRLVYFGQLDWLRERLEPREYFTLRDRVNAGDMQWLRSRFLSSDITWIKHAVQRGDRDALRAANRLGQLGWLEPVIPADDYRQLRARLDADDLDWMQQRLPRWSLERLVDTDPAAGVAEPQADALVLTPLAPANRIDGSTSSPSEFYDVFAGVDEMPRTPPVAIVSDLPPRARYRRPRRLSPAWIAAIVMLLAAGALAYLSLRDSNERATTTVPTVVSTTVSPTVTVAPSTVAPSTVAATAPPAPTTLAPLATDVVYFAAGSTSISTQAAAVLDAAAAKIKANPGLTVKLTGVADASGTAATNAQVSQRRAQAVQDALKARGADAKFEITAAGTDASVPPDKARRVEIAYVRP
jgi:outer membrane protein OmpA-like peptidoglycan-associated protein